MSTVIRKINCHTERYFTELRDKYGGSYSNYHFWFQGCIHCRGYERNRNKEREEGQICSKLQELGIQWPLRRTSEHSKRDGRLLLLVLDRFSIHETMVNTLRLALQVPLVGWKESKRSGNSGCSVGLQEACLRQPYHSLARSTHSTGKFFSQLAEKSSPVEWVESYILALQRGSKL